MYRIIDGRSSGKTSRLMLLAKETNAAIACSNISMDFVNFVKSPLAFAASKFFTAPSRFSDSCELPRPAPLRLLCALTALDLKESSALV